MRRLIFVGSIVVGAAIGLLSTLGDDWGLKLLMVSLGALVGTAVGGGLSKIGRGGSCALREGRALRGLGTTPEDLLDNYWRDEGHPQFMKPPSPDDKQFGGSGATSE
jgi:hypothetical protein